MNTVQPERLVLVTGDGPEHRYVANRICMAHDVAEILVCDPAPRRAWHRVLRRDPVRFVDKALWRIVLAATRDDAARTAGLRAVLGAQMCDSFHEAQKCRHVGRASGPELLAAVSSAPPDILAVYGTSLVPDTVLSKARLAALNMHTGISPFYRGTACAFWPVHEGDFDRIGATVHDCTALVDGGRIHQTANARPQPGDDLHRIFARCVEAGAQAYVEVLNQALNGTLKGQVQDMSVGREYKGSMRGLKAELIARWRLRRFHSGA